MKSAGPQQWGLPLKAKKAKEELGMKKSEVRAFMRFLQRVEAGSLARGICLAVREHEFHGIVLDQQSVDNANRSGLTNSGVTFHPTPEWHTLSKDALGKWEEFLKSDKAEEFFKALANQEGIYVILNGTKVQALTKDEIPGRTIFDIAN